MNEHILGQDVILWKQTRVKWEYKVLEVTLPEQLSMDKFSELGEDGWEIVYCLEINKRTAQFLFKRVKE